MATTPEAESPPDKIDIESGLETFSKGENGGLQNLDGTSEEEPCLPPRCEGPVPDPLPNASTPKSKLTLTKQNGRVTWRKPEIEGHMRKKFGVNRDGYLLSIGGCVLIILLVIIIIVLVALWPASAYSGETCAKAACLRASSVIVPTMDLTVEPCTDLYAHACGGWSRRYPKPPPTRSRWDPKSELGLRLAEQVRDVIATLPYPTRINSVTWKIKYLYDSCMALDNIETDGKRPLKRIINELGGWNVLREFSVLAWDFSQTLVRLHGEYGVSPFFLTSVVPHPSNSSRSILELSPSPLGLPHSQFYQHKEEKMASSYRNYMKDVVQLLGATSTDAKLFSEDMFYFERRIAEVLPSVAELEDTRNHQLLNVSHLKTIAPSVPIHEILSALHPSANVDDHTPLLVRSARFMTSLSNIMATTDRSALNNYVMWQFTKAYLPYLSREFLDIHFVYLRDTTGVSEPLERWEVCISALLRFQGVAVAARLQKAIPIADRLARKALLDDMFGHLRWAVKDSVTKAEWIDLELYQHLVKKLDNLTLESGLSEYYIDDVHLEEFYSKLFVQKNDFFQNIRYGIKFLNEDMQRRYSNPKPEYTWLSETTKTEVTYIPSTNTLLVPQPLLQEPWFHTDYPPGLIYGGLGVQLARAILSAILPPNGLYSANGTLLPSNGLVANLSRTSIDNQLNCLKGNSSAQGLSTFLSISGIRQAFKALKRAVRGQSIIKQPGLETLSDARLLTLRYAQSQCVVQTTADFNTETAIAAPLKGPTLLSAVTSNLKAVAEVLGCSAPTSSCKHLL